MLYAKLVRLPGINVKFQVQMYLKFDVNVLKRTFYPVTVIKSHAMQVTQYDVKSE